LGGGVGTGLTRSLSCRVACICVRCVYVRTCVRVCLLVPRVRACVCRGVRACVRAYVRVLACAACACVRVPRRACVRTCVCLRVLACTHG
jgi:hypothetical protein